MQRRTLQVAGSPYEIPYFEFSGTTEGPLLTLIAGIHGAEYASQAALRKFVKELIDVSDSEITGRLRIAPIVNLSAFFSRTPFVVPEDQKNLNRSFPGDPDGTAAEILADSLFTNLIKDSDYVVDMHAGDIPESLTPFSILEESDVESKSLAMAQAYGISHVVRQHKSTTVVGGSTCKIAAEHGIPAIIAESGQNGILTSESVAIHLRGVRNLARSLGIISGQVETFAPVTVYEGWYWLRSKTQGWWSPAFECGVQVKAGTLLGTIEDLWGERIEEVYAPVDGVVLFQTSSPAMLPEGILIGLAIS